MTHWTNEDETVIRCLHGRFRNKVIATILGRTEQAVEVRVSNMRKRGLIGVYRSATDQPARAFGGAA